MSEPRDDVAMRMADRCIDDARAAIQWGREAGHLSAAMIAAARLYLYWARGAVEEGVELLDGLLADADTRPGEASPAAVQIACNSLAGLSNLRGEPERALALVDRALAIDDDGNGRLPTALMLLNRGLVLPQIGDVEGGAAALTAAIEASHGLPGRYVQWSARTGLAGLAFRRGDIEEADRIIGASWGRHSPGAVMTTGLAHLTEWTAAVLIRRGELDPARVHLLDVLRHLETYRPRVCVAHAVESTSAWLVAAGHPRDAAVLAGAASSMRAADGTPILWFESAFGESLDAELQSALSDNEHAEAAAEGAAVASADETLDLALALLEAGGPTI